MAVFVGSSWFRGQDIEPLPDVNAITYPRLHLSITVRGPSCKHPGHKPPPRPIDPDIATSPSNTGSALAMREPRSFKRETLSPAQGPWTTDLCAWTLTLGQGSRVQARYQYIDLQQAKRNDSQSGASRLSKKQQ